MSDLQFRGSSEAGMPDGRSLALWIKGVPRAPLVGLRGPAAGRGVEPQGFSNE
jgi:hypothetical protein